MCRGLTTRGESPARSWNSSTGCSGSGRNAATAVAATAVVAHAGLTMVAAVSAPAAHVAGVRVAAAGVVAAVPPALVAAVGRCRRLGCGDRTAGAVAVVGKGRRGGGEGPERDSRGDRDDDPAHCSSLC